MASSQREFGGLGNSMNVLMCQGTPREGGAGARAQEHARCHPGSMASTAAQVQPVCVPPASPCKDRGGDSARFCAHWGLRKAHSPHKVPAPRKVRHQGSLHGDPSGLAGPCPRDRYRNRLGDHLKGTQLKGISWSPESRLASLWSCPHHSATALNRHTVGVHRHAPQGSQLGQAQK